jgi:IS5 family transposase
MSGERYQSGQMGSFYGSFFYDAVVPKDDFLRKLGQVVPWQRFTYKLIKYYRGKGCTGRPPYDPAVLLKMLLLGYLYNLSECDVERFCNRDMPAKCFLGIAATAKAPNHSTLTVFKRRILENGKLAAFEKMLEQIILIAMESGIAFGALQLIDSTHSVADVNVEKENHRREQGKSPRDASAQWGVKHKKTVRDEKGRKIRVPEYFYGYKMHSSFNANAQMITSVKVSGGGRYDGHYLPSLIASDLDQGLPIEVCTADRGYDDTDNHFFLQTKGIHSAIHLNRYRTHKKDANKQVWLELKAQPWYQPALDHRYQIERKFGEAKSYHGLRRCRYLGLLRYGIQAYLTAIALNLKRLVRVLTGVPFKGQAPVMD